MPVKPLGKEDHRPPGQQAAGEGALPRPAAQKKEQVVDQDCPQGRRKDRLPERKEPAMRQNTAQECDAVAFDNNAKGDTGQAVGLDQGFKGHAMICLAQERSDRMGQNGQKIGRATIETTTTMPSSTMPGRQ